MNETDTTAMNVAVTAPPILSRNRVEAERHDLALAWVTAEILGALAISFIPGSVGLWRMFAPLSFMAGYLAFAFTRSQYNTPRIADSAYFMGFWWTLWALISVLLSQGEKNPLTAAKLYETFGYALTTTAAGMFIRLTLLQFYRTLDDQEDQAVDQIDQRVTKLVGELELTQQALGSLRASGVLALQQWHKQFLVASDQTVADLRHMTENLTAEGEGLGSSVKTVQQSLASVGRLFTTLEKRLGASIDSTTSVFEQMAESLQSSLKVLVKRLEDVEVPPDVIRSKVNQVLDSIDKAVVPIASLAANTLAQLNRAVADVGKAVVDFPKSERLDSAVLNLTEKLNLVTQACGHLALQAETTRSALSSVGTGASIIVAQLMGAEQSVAELRKEAESLRAVVGAVGNDTEKMNATVTNVVRFVQDQLGRR
jgi:MotA/TolQ/ExbB proton channel family protein